MISYKCTSCDKIGHKLWRQSQTCTDAIDLLCLPCAEEDQDEDFIDYTFRSDQIGLLVPAIPDEEMYTYWGYTSVPQDRVDWWHSLETGNDRHGMSTWTSHKIEEGIDSYKANWAVYIVECSDGTLYTGISNNVEKRVKTHNSGKGAKYTRARLPVKLMWTEPARSRSMAAKRECEIKKLPRAKKLLLLNNTVV